MDSDNRKEAVNVAQENHNNDYSDVINSGVCDDVYSS